ncbi:MAG: GNAT family N-acetyltransferase [Candidatus Accumulibacter sp.]|jgi:DNA-binding transcriptional ArsR family regulator|nr:GNAT family N-acetyltransferase [Accumulibacter sp.]
MPADPSGSTVSSGAPRWLCGAEPDMLAEYFLRHPPEDFQTFACSSGMPGFRADYDLLTTADERTRAWFEKLPGKRFLRRWLRWRACFLGSAVSEFCPLPPAPPGELVRSLFAAWRRDSALLIVKDIAHGAPFLSGEANRLADRFVEACEASGFFVVEGMALAWVPIDFASEDEYLARLSSARRRDIRRKLRRRERLRVEIHATGDDWLTRPEVLAELYAQYLEVFTQSETHFDRLTPAYFQAVLADASLDGRVFLYSLDGRPIGFNLCFIHDGMLVDKTIGFRYPAARENNLYFVSWMENLAYARREGLRCYIAGWTDPAVKAALGARFTPTRHAVYARNPLLRRILRRIAGHFEPDKRWLDAGNARATH